MEVLKKHFDTALESPEGVKKLRELILTLAMQGKLVPQDPKDPPASELLKEIQTEKGRLIKEGKIKLLESNSEVSQEKVPFKIPTSWSWEILPDVTYFQEGPGIMAKDFSDHGIPLIRIAGMKGDFVTLDGCNFINKDLVREKWGHYKLDLGDIVLTSSASLGNVAKVDKRSVGCIVYTGLIRFKYFCADTDKYLIWFFRSPEFIRQINENKTGAAIQHFGPTHLKKMIFPLPPLAEQKRIIAKIDELMALCNKLEEKRASRDQKRLAVHTSAINRLLTAVDKKEFQTSWQFITRHFDPIYSVKENVAELKKAILTLAMQGKLVPQDPNDPPASELLKEIQAEKEKLIAEGKIKKQKELPAIKPEEVPYEVPEGWVWVNLRHVTHDWGQKKPDHTFTYIDVGSIDNSKGIISKEPQIVLPKNAPSRARKIVNIGTIIYSTVRPYLLNIAIVEKEYLYEPIASTAFAIMHPYNGMDVRFLYLYLNSNIFISYVENKQKGVAYPAISDGDLFQGILPLPPLAEQKRIVAKIDELMALCDKLETQIDQATQKQTALFNAVLAQV